MIYETPHRDIYKLIADKIHKDCSAVAMKAIWRAAFRDAVDWRHYKGGRYLYLNLTWDAENDEWAVQYARPDLRGVTFTRRLSNFFGTAVNERGEMVLRFTPWEDS